MPDARILALKLFSRLSLPINHAIGAAVGGLIAILPLRQVRHADINLRRCMPELSARRRRQIRRRSFMHLGRMATESGRLWLGDPHRQVRLIREVRGLELLEQAQQQGRGVLLASPHIGSWEMLNLYFALHHPLTAMYKPQRGPVNEVIRHSRERLGSRMVTATPGGVRSLLRALERGELAGVLPDRAGVNGSVFAEFFGHQVLTPTLTTRLAARTGAPVLFAIGERLPLARGYRIHLRAGPADIANADEQAGARALNRGLEECIRAFPEQYWWSFRRFRKRPAGEPRWY